MIPQFHGFIVVSFFSVFLLSLRYFHDVLRVKFTDRVSISTSTCSSCPSLFFLVIVLYSVLHIQWLVQLRSNSWNNQIYKETRWSSASSLFDTQVASHRFYQNNVGDLTIAFLLLRASTKNLEIKDSNDSTKIRETRGSNNLRSGISNRKFARNQRCCYRKLKKRKLLRCFRISSWNLVVSAVPEARATS